VIGKIVTQICDGRYRKVAAFFMGTGQSLTNGKP
jgi:hypothetical protein